MVSDVEAGRNKFNKVVSLGVNTLNRLGAREVGNGWLVGLCGAYVFGMLALAQSAEAYRPGEGWDSLVGDLAWEVPALIVMHRTLEYLHLRRVQPIFSSTLENL